jgi:type 1 glutamine amidotransferase
MYPGIKVLMMHDVSTINPDQKELVTKNLGTFSNYFPAVWYQDFQGGHVWISTLGHDKNNYQNHLFKNHLLQGIQFIANQYNGIHFEKAFSKSKDDPTKY